MHSDGITKLYRIGELAKLTDLSPRTIDYYTKLGLIEPKKRSDTNYRLYDHETLLRLKRIEQWKKEKYTLDEIKVMLDSWQRVSSDEQITEKLSSLQLHLEQLEKQAKELQPLIDQMKPRQAKAVFKSLAPHTVAAVDALLLLLGKNPFM
ncbi:MerR family transcriptional regulator [Paenibacillus sp. y28]|uniref:MerR family transcriptional regulator n=1 Tax=Paenibacillus sp. y28 TaxID=3129110 RepID=UPI00301A27DF